MGVEFSEVSKSKYLNFKRFLLHSVFHVFVKMSKIMENTSVNGDEHMKLYVQVAEKSRQENLALAAVTSETLTKLNISIDALPQKSQQLLLKAAEHQQALDIAQLDPIAISLRHSRELAEQLEDEYELLKLKQKNDEVQTKIDRNNKFMEDLRRELTSSRESLRLQSPNPESVQELVRQMRQKVFAYEESCELAKTKFSKLTVPEACYPKSLELLASTLEALRAEALALQQRAEDITLAREARDLLNATRR